jgi:hypothetical protein
MNLRSKLLTFSMPMLVVWQVTVPGFVLSETEVDADDEDQGDE